MRHTSSAIKKIFSLRGLLTTVLAIMALVAFNIGRPGIQSVSGASFNIWYPHALDRITHLSDGNSHSDNAEEKQELPIKITITIKHPSTAAGLESRTWEISTATPSTSDLKMQAPLPDLARTLELIYESKVFEISPVSQPLNNSTAYLQIKIVDGENRFETTVRYKSIEDNIQLRNLLTLLGN